MVRKIHKKLALHKSTTGGSTTKEPKPGVSDETTAGAQRTAGSGFLADVITGVSGMTVGSLQLINL